MLKFNVHFIYHVMFQEMEGDRNFSLLPEETKGGETAVVKRLDFLQNLVP